MVDNNKDRILTEEEREREIEQQMEAALSGALSSQSQDGINPTIIPPIVGNPARTGKQVEAAEYGELARQHLSWYKEIDLKSLFPISPLFSIHKSIWTILACIFSWVVYLYFYGITGLIAPESFGQHLLLICIGLFLAACMGTLVYWEVYRRTLVYKLDGFRFYVCRGVFKKVRASMALVPVTQIFIKQDIIDMIFDLYNVDIFVPNCPPEEIKFSMIPCLSFANAQKFQKYLGDQMNRQVFIAGTAIEIEEQIRLAEEMRDIQGDQ